jgi:hypothetical protein
MSVAGREIDFAGAIDRSIADFDVDVLCESSR